MPNQKINTDKAPLPIGPYSQAIITAAQKLIFISGQIPLDPTTSELKTDIKEATHQVMNNLQAILQEAGLTFDEVIKTTIFLTDMKDFSQVNEIYGSYFNNKELFPARETVQVAALPKGSKVEISMIATMR